MKKFLLTIAATISLGVAPAFAQPGGHGGPSFDHGMDKLFGANQTFSCTMEMQMSGRTGDNMTMTGKMSFDTGKSRFEMNMSDMRGASLPPSAMEQMKAMGMDVVISISRPDKKLAYIIYPNLKSYAEQAATDSASGTGADEPKIETTEDGKETVDGHDCVKNKVTITDKDGTKHQFEVWDATDLKNFPVKISILGEAQPVTMSFKDLSFSKPDASKFEPPTGLTKYDSVQTMMQTEMMKHMGGAGRPPGQQ